MLEEAVSLIVPSKKLGKRARNDQERGRSAEAWIQERSNRFNDILILKLMMLTLNSAVIK